MNATVVDMRYRMNDVLKALDRNETVNVVYHGRVKGVLVPAHRKSPMKMSEHPFFRMRSAKGSVDSEMEALRGGRYRDL